MSSPTPSLLEPVPDTQAAAFAASPRRRQLDVGTIVDALVLVALTLAGLFSPVGPVAFYEALAVGFAGIASVVLLGAGAVTLISERRSDRLQGVRRAPARIARGVRDTSIAAWVAACLLAWPLSRLMSGLPTGLTWSLEEAGGGVRAVLQTLVALVVLDACSTGSTACCTRAGSSRSTAGTTATVIRRRSPASPWARSSPC